MVPTAAAQDYLLGKAAIVGAFIFMILSNALSFSGIFGGNIGEISNEFPTYVTPDGLTFSVWGVIYLLELILTIVQCCSSVDADKLLGLGVRYRIALAFVLNGIWLPLYSAKLFFPALVIIVAYLATLISVVVVVNAWTVSNLLQWFVYAAPISANASWLVVATAANFFTVLGELGWSTYGVAGTVPAALLVVMLATAVGAIMAVAMLDVAWALVVAWALRGLYRMQAMANDAFPPEAKASTLANWAYGGSVVAVVAAELGLLFGIWLTCQGRIWNGRPVGGSYDEYAVPMAAQGHGMSVPA